MRVDFAEARRLAVFPEARVAAAFPASRRPGMIEICFPAPVIVMTGATDFTTGVFPAAATTRTPTEKTARTRAFVFMANTSRKRIRNTSYRSWRGRCRIRSGAYLLALERAASGLARRRVPRRNSGFGGKARAGGGDGPGGG